MLYTVVSIGSTNAVDSNVKCYEHYGNNPQSQEYNTVEPDARWGRGAMSLHGQASLVCTN